MKALHIITGLNVGGAETMLARLMDSAQAMPDIQSEIITLMPPGALGPRIAATGVPVHSLGMRGGVPSISAAVRLAAIARRIRPDLIMGWMHHGQLAASLAALAAPGHTPMIWNVRHSLSGFRQEKMLTRMLLRICTRLSSLPEVIVYNSRSALDQYRAFGYKPRRDMVIPNGFDQTVYQPREEARRTLCARFGISNDRVIIGMVARNHPMKDVANLASAFGRVLDAERKAHLLLVGNEMDQPSKMAAERLGILPQESWTLRGHRSDVAEWLAGLDILALPSAWGEGFPNIIGEAMACGVPCVATDVGDAAWVVGTTGRAVPPRDPVALGAALTELARMGRDARETLGRAARSRVEENFMLPDIAQRYATLLRECGGAQAAEPQLPVSPALAGGAL